MPGSHKPILIIIFFEGLKVPNGHGDLSVKN